jgi:uncharacterized damage-inducible protein DinB
LTLDELYPYWGQAHEDFVERVRLLSAEQVKARPMPGAASVHDVVLRFVTEERFWVSHLVGGNEWETPRPKLFLDGPALAEGLTAARDVTARVLAPLGPAGLRAVRRVPADAHTNRMESNMPIGLLFWHVVERELYAWGQVQLRLDDAHGRGRVSL